MLLVCSQLRRKSCSQSEVFARKASALGVRADLYPVAKTHGAINEDLGLANDYTARVDQFVDGVCADGYWRADRSDGLADRAVPVWPLLRIHFRLLLPV